MPPIMPLIDEPPPEPLASPSPPNPFIIVPPPADPGSKAFEDPPPPELTSGSLSRNRL